MTEVWCTDRVVASRLVRDYRTECVQALFRRIITPRGTLRGGPEEDAYGLDVSGYVGAVGTETALSALPGLVRGEWLKDDRVVDAAIESTITTDAAGQSAVLLSCSVVLVDEDEPLALSVLVTDVSTELIGGTA